MTDFEKSPFSFMGEEYKCSYGMHKWSLFDGSTVMGISAPAWQTYLDHLKSSAFENQIVVSPELITLTDITDEPLIVKEEVEKDG